MKFLRFLAVFVLLSLAISHRTEGASNDGSAPPSGEPPDGWTALPSGRVFGVLPSDPRDLKLGLRGNNKSEMEGDVGGYRSLAGWSGNGCLFTAGIEGAAYFQMRKEGARFPLQSSDGLFGVYGETAHGPWAWQLRFTHISAHVSDGLTAVRPAFVFSREFLALRLKRQIDWLTAYAGYQVLVSTKPALPRHSLQLGAYTILPIHWGIAHPYFGADLRVRGAEEGTTFVLGTGVAFVASNGLPPVRLTASYLKGHDLRGQFYMEKTEKWIFGLDLDL